MSLRVTRLDPSFHRAALFASGILAWFHGIERPDEAADLLNEGMRRSPEQPLYALYLAAIAYKKVGNTDRMIALLESSFDLADTPATMKAILANLRQSRGEIPASPGALGAHPRQRARPFGACARRPRSPSLSSCSPGPAPSLSAYPVQLSSRIAAALSVERDFVTGQAAVEIGELPAEEPLLIEPRKENAVPLPERKLREAFVGRPTRGRLPAHTPTSPSNFVTV